MNKHHFKASTYLLIITALLSACSVLAPEPTRTPKPTSTAEPTSTPEPTPTSDPTETATLQPTKPPLPTSTSTPKPEEETKQSGAVDITALCRQDVDGITALHNEIESFDFYDGDITDALGLFDVNMYFSVLEHIYLEEGYYLDHLFFSDYLGSKPMLYAVPQGDGPFQTYEDFLAYLGEEMLWEESAYSTLSHNYDYLEYIQIDESSGDGYFEFTLLALLGGQFHLSWHALYNDTIILCDSSDLDRVETDIEDFDVTIDPALLDQAQKLDLTPTVQINSDTVEIRIVTFSKWGGFSETTYIMDRYDPYYLIDVQWNTLIEYDCGIMF